MNDFANIDCIGPTAFAQMVHHAEFDYAGCGGADVAVEAHKILWREALRVMPAYPGDYRGRGVVICAGGSLLFANAWVCAYMLRKFRCDLPVEFWYLGPTEIDDQMRQIASMLGVKCVDAEKVRVSHPARILRGWELKAFALLNCSFQEVVLLDADNVPLIDPSALFRTPEYDSCGAIFWPDYGRLAPSRMIWRICEVEYRNEPEFESGQIVVDKERCWQALGLAMHFNEHSDFYYRHIHGDKETFHMAFRRCGKPYAMPDHPIFSLSYTMCQHDFDGNRIFQHRNGDKWRFDGSNDSIEGFLCEDVCRQALQELRQQWDGRINSPRPRGGTEEDLFNSVVGQRFQYTRVGYDSRVMAFEKDGTIGDGSAACERYWSINQVDGEWRLLIYGDDNLTCQLSQRAAGWRGHWLRHERMPIELDPVKECASGSRECLRAKEMLTAQAHQAVLARRPLPNVRRGTPEQVPSPGQREEMSDAKHFWESGAGGHYDRRFYRGDVDESERIAKLVATLAAFVAAADQMRVTPILMHGALLGWWWNKQLLPWDPDIDVCLSLDDLRRSERSRGAFAHDGETYLWDVNPNYTTRTTMNATPLDSLEPNKIDARFIDSANGLYIDVTALAELSTGVFSTKCPHAYRKDLVLPTRVDVLNGIPVNVPNEVQAVLVQEYGGQSIRNPDYGGFHFDYATKVWVKTTAR